MNKIGEYKMSEITEKYLNEAGVPKLYRKRGNSDSIAKAVVDQINKLVIQLEDEDDPRSKEVDRLGMKIVTIMSKKRKLGMFTRGSRLQ